MTSIRMIARSSAAVALALLATAMPAAELVPTAAAQGAANAIPFAPHRAIYDLSLASTRGKKQLASVRGRIVYDFSGSTCEGYSLQFRQVTELDSGEGKQVVSDLRAVTWEEGEAKSFRFMSENFMNRELIDAVEGSAERGSDKVAVKLVKPEPKDVELDPVIFPTEQMRRIIAAARAGQTLLELPVYDGSETGEKVYSTLTVIGQPIPPDTKKPNDAAADQAALAGMMRWPVTISYFDKAGSGGEQTPVYSIAFELYENGLSRALVLDYGDFVVSGQMSSLELKDAKPCQ